MAEARGQTARYLKVFEEYKKAPDVTRQRLYLETMERVLGAGDKIILDRAARHAACFRSRPSPRPRRNPPPEPSHEPDPAGRSSPFSAFSCWSSAFPRPSNCIRPNRRCCCASASRCGLVAEPGLHFKLPLIETVVYLDKRILDLESMKQEVLASDNQRLEVDAFVRYKIADPLKFYQTVGSVSGADNQLGSVLNSAVRRVLGEANQTQIVRDDRPALTAKIREEVNHEAERFGVSINDARIRRVDLPRQISEKVFDRMRTERGREAAEYRALGQQEAQQIRSSAQRDATVIVAEAQQNADSHARRRRGGTQPHVRRRRSTRTRTSSPSIVRCRPMTRR